MVFRLELIRVGLFRPVAYLRSSNLRFFSTANDSSPPEKVETPKGPIVTVTKNPNGVYFVALNRPERHNALDISMFREIRRVAVELRTDRSCRAIVLHGNGPSFCSGWRSPSPSADFHALFSGLDFSKVMSNPLNFKELLERHNEEVANLAQDAAYAWRMVPCPVIAAIHGACFGGGKSEIFFFRNSRHFFFNRSGLQIALAADIRIASKDSRLSIMGHLFFL